MSTEPGVALVTGASSGFGRLIAITLALHGHRVFGAFRGSRGGFSAQAHDLARRAESEGATVEAVRMDVRDDDSVAAAVAEVEQRAGGIDVVVNAAGYGLLGPFECTDLDETRRLFETNVFGTMRVVAAVLPGMRSRGSGTVVNIGSDVGLRANFFQTAYASSKFAVEGFTQSLRLEARPFGIDVVLVVPGWYDTEFGDSVVLTFGTGPAAPAYEALVAARDEGVDRVEGPNDDPQEVADVVLEAVQTPDPAFRYAVGWNPERMVGVELDEVDAFQRHLLTYYGLEEFAGPST